VLIADVEQGSPAAEAGLQRGDLIVEVNRKKVASVDELKKVLDQSKEGSMLLLVKRKNASLFVVLQGK
jgi:S1-C subfamily serine protease